MKKLIYSLLFIVTFLWITGCSTAEIRQAQVMSQAEIDEYNKKIHPEGDEPDDPTPPGPDDPTPPDPVDPTPVIPDQDDYYVSVAGAGVKTGADLANAMDQSTFRNFISLETNAAKVDGATFHFADGTYTLSDDLHPDGLSVGFPERSADLTVTFAGGEGAIFSGSGKFRILSVQPFTKLTLKGITLSNGYTTGHGGAITARGCSLVLEDCIVSGNKSDGTTEKNGNNGGAIYLANDVISAQFTNCVFTDNRIVPTGTDQYGGAVRIEASKTGNDVNFDNCLFRGNFAKQAACISVNAKTRLRINRCEFIGNSAASRGMIQIANCVVFLNGSLFYDNHTTDNNGWGVDMHGKGYICMNGCTVYANNNSITGDNNNVALNGYHSLLMTNSTVIEANYLGQLRIDDASGKQVLCNNILVNTTGKSVLVGNASATTVSAGHNAMGAVTGFDSFTAHATDLMNCTESSFGAHAFDQAQGVYTWSGVLPGFTSAVQDDVVKAMKEDFDVSLSDVMSHIGPAFFEWLDGMSPKAYAADGRGVARSGAWWPGAFQGGKALGNSLGDLGEVVIH